MNRKKITPKKSTKKNNNRQSEPLPVRYILLTLTCGLILVVGFFFAARQHFSAIDYGIKNSKLKKQIDELETDKRQLILAKEIALTPGEIKKAAQKIGLTMMTASNIEVFRPNGEVKEKPQASKNDDVKPKQISPVKTVAAKTEVKKIEKAENKTPEVKSEKEKTAVKTAKK
ncbi:MAG: hypothetical protein ABIP06_13700 [Pyrinomonadaceae bacterium]